MRRATVIIVAAMAIVCVEEDEVHVDEGIVCFVPQNCPCDSLETCEVGCDYGELDADATFKVITTPFSACDRLEELECCSVTQTGDFELTIQTSLRARPVQSCLYPEDEEACYGKTYDCGEGPPLAAGTWTVHYGDTTRQLEVPGSKELSTSEERWNCFTAPSAATTGE